MDLQKKVLIVEDNPNARMTIQDSLAGLRYKTFEAVSGEDALIRIRQHKKKRFDVIVLDLGLPGIDGIETLKRIRAIADRESFPLPAVVVLTGIGNFETAMQAGRLGAFDYLRKNPIDRTKLKESVYKASSWRPYPNSLIVKRCFKYGDKGCRYQIGIKENQVFVGMSFNPDTALLYEVIKEVIHEFDLECWRGDEDMSSGDITCKLCGSLQESKLAIMDYSGPNSNVCFEIGLAYGFGKRVILLKDERTPAPVDLQSFIHVEYSDATSLANKLRKAVKDNLAN